MFTIIVAFVTAIRCAHWLAGGPDAPPKFPQKFFLAKRTVSLQIASDQKRNFSMQNKRVTITLRAPLYNWLARRARKDGRTISSEVAQSLEDFCNDRVREGMLKLMEKEAQE